MYQRPRNRSRRGLLRIIATIAIASAPATTWGAERDAEPLAEVYWGLTEITFQPKVHSGTRLVVTGPGFARQASFEAGSSPSFLAAQEDYSPLADGTYRYELRQIPTKDAVDVDGVKIRPLSQRAVFHIVNGMIEGPDAGN